MTVKQLIEILSQHEHDAKVIMSKDGEGSSYSPLSDIAPCVYKPETTWSGEIIDFDDLDEKEQERYSASLYLNDGEYLECVCLWPTN